MDFKNEAIFSILSYLEICDNADKLTIIVYTDSALYFESVLGQQGNIIYEEIDSAQWQAWRGDIDFVHRAKIEVIKHALEKNGGNILYLDSDTFFLKDPKPIYNAIESGIHFLHVREGLIANGSPLHIAIYDFLMAHPAEEWSAISIHTAMYNAGAIGLSRKDLKLLIQTISLTDKLYRAYPSHVMEQLAFSIVLNQNGPAGEVAPFVLHYWHMKEVRSELDKFFGENAGKPLPILLARLREFPIVEASSQKDIWEKRHRWQRALMRLMGIGWKWPANHRKLL
ncbi:hypothetical protein [Hymenobacter amundsenii]|uniref:hypothetical protein n=1 Tax=Hymenobacter amundsenii TaxID=2006685 RepID=UPI000F825E31|nr:hypothetical protein [Hymenobacter amundsenii]